MLTDNYTLSNIEIQEIANRAAELALTKAGLVKNQVSTREAYRRYGRNRVIEWRKNLLITPHKQGGIIYYGVVELEKASIRNIL